jgi:hypothetical protein
LLTFESDKRQERHVGNIGDPLRHITFEPLPATEPVHEPAAPAPTEPEKTPA